MGTPVIHYLSTDKDYLLTKEAIGHDTLAFLDQPEKICRTMAEALKKLHSFYPQNFPSDNHLQAYKERALKNYEKGEFYAKALLPQFRISSREEAFQLIREQGHLLKTDAFIHGDACLPNFILKDADHFSCFIDLGLADFSDRHIDLFWAVWSLNYNLHDPKYAELFLDYYGREQVDVNNFDSLLPLKRLDKRKNMKITKLEKKKKTLSARNWQGANLLYYRGYHCSLYVDQG